VLKEILVTRELQEPLVLKEDQVIRSLQEQPVPKGEYVIRGKLQEQPVLKEILGDTGAQEHWC